MVHPLRMLPPGASLGDLEPPAMDHSVGGGQPCQYSPDMARIILARVERGESVGRIAADPAMPSYRTIYDWLLRIPDFGDAWDELRGEQAARRRAKALVGRRRGKGGRKSTYTRERAEAWSDLIMAGYTLREAAARPEMPGVATLYLWLRNHPEFRELFRRTLYLRNDRLAHAACHAASAFGDIEGVKRLHGRMGALRPDVWRWWD